MSVTFEGMGFDSTIEYIEDQVSEVKYNFSLVLDEILQDRSPVDTGRFKANWTFATGEYDDRYIERNSRGASRSARSLPKTKLDERDVYISNNAPYARKLNNGSSKQAPKLFIERSIQDASNKVFK